VRRIGRGGSGHVFLAEQTEPVRRRVALKVVPEAALDPELAARFDVERRALERLTHKNVARLLDAGRTPDGLPYLVMDYVDGVPLTEYCTQLGLPLAARARLLLEVAAGVEHAHQRGIIHRDLKPANVVVTEVDGRPTPVVIDFGIAKARAGVTASFPATLGWPMGTPGYMAPEQAGFGEVDTRADVYALGALLYELIAGRPPIEPGADLATTFARLRDITPPAPSRVRGATLRDDATTRALLTDLDVITLRALDKAKEQRYPSVSAWRDDVERALTAQPIAARPPTWLYRARCFARRERKLAVAVLAIAAALVLGVVGLSLGLLSAAREQRRAVDEKRAQEEINAFLADDVLGAASPDQVGPDANVRALLDRAGERIAPRFAARPLIAAALHHTVGEIYAQLSEHAHARRHLERALALRVQHAGGAAPATLHSEIAVASLLARQERYDEAEPQLRALLARGRQLLPADDPVLFSALNDLGITLSGLGRDAEAVAPLTEALAGRRRVLGEQHLATFESLSNLALVRGNLGPTEAAIAAYEQALAAARALADPPRATLLGLENNLGATLQDVERNAEAKPHLEAAAVLASKLFVADHPAVLQIQSNLAGLEADLGNPEHAATLYADVAARLTARVGADAEATLAARHGQWTALGRAKRHAEAAAGFATLLADVARALPAHLLVTKTRQSLAVALRDGGDPSAALPHAEQAAREFTTQLGAEHPRVLAATKLVQDIRAVVPGGKTGAQ
jgi:tetratricopeptide (TPR) repeat protein